MQTPFLRASFPNEGLGFLCSRQQVSSSPGARFGKLPMLPTCKTWRITRMPRPKRRPRECLLTPNAMNLHGVNGLCQNCTFPVFKPMPTCWWWRNQRTRRSTTGHESPPWTKATHCVSRSNSPLITKKPSKVARSIPPPRSLSAKASGGSR